MSGGFVVFGGGGGTSGGGGGTTYTPPIPPQIQGLGLWLKASVGVTVDGSNNVSKWVDQGPNGFTFTQLTAANQPLLVNGAINSKPVVRFYGNPSALDADLTNPALLTTATSGWRLYFILKHNGFTASPQYQCPLFFPTSLSPTNDRGWILISNDASYSDVAFGSGATFAKTRSGSIGLSTTGFHTLSIAFDGVASTGTSDFSYTLDSTLATTTTNAGYGTSVTTGLNSMRIGARGVGDFPLQADIAEIIIYTQAVSPANHAKLMAYVNSEYLI